MKVLRLFSSAVFLLLTFSAFSQNAQVFDLKSLAKNGGLRVYNRQISIIDESSYPGIHLSKDFGEGIAWLKGIDLSNGIIEFDVRGENVKQHSFVGLAFHGVNDSTFDAIYLRPFQFNEEDEASRKKALQYISLPKFTWQVLREKFPGKYENSIEPTPNPDAWIRVKIVIINNMVATYINGSNEPSLVAEKTTPVRSGAVGFYVADTSGGDFANISITKTD